MRFDSRPPSRYKTRYRTVLFLSSRTIELLAIERHFVNAAVRAPESPSLPRTVRFEFAEELAEHVVDHLLLPVALGTSQDIAENVDHLLGLDCGAGGHIALLSR
jgi:hypothetical protein